MAEMPNFNSPTLYSSNRQDMYTKFRCWQKQIGLGRQLTDWYKDATAVPFGLLIIDLYPGTSDNLRFSTDSTSFPAKFYLPSSRAKTTSPDDKRSELQYTKALTNFQKGPPENFPTEYPKNFIRFLCVSEKFGGRKHTRYSAEASYPFQSNNQTRTLEEKFTPRKTCAVFIHEKIVSVQ